MKEFLTSVIVFVVMTVVILWAQPHKWFYHGMTCTGGIGGGCDTTTATGGIYRWMNK